MSREVGWEWKTTGWWVRPKTARDVMSMIGSIGVYSTGQQFAWRGMSSADHLLSSSLHRVTGGGEDEVREAELATIAEARSWGLGTHATGQVDDLQLLSDLQHFGISTRLIDVSSNPMTALWFASQPATSLTKSGLLLALNVTNWPRLSTVSAEMTYARVADPLAARLRFQLEQASPFVVESGNPNARLRAQEGFFVAGRVPEPKTLPGSSGYLIRFLDVFPSLNVAWKQGDPVLLEKRLTTPRSVGAPGTIPFVAMFINAGLKQKLRQYLAGTYNRSARTLFPDYEGFRAFGQHVHHSR